MYRIVLLLIFVCSLSSSFAQQHDHVNHNHNSRDLLDHSRVRIDMRNTTVSQLAMLGLEVDHGLLEPGVHFVHDLSTYEINLLREAGIPFRIEIADVVAHYRNQMGAGAYSSRSAEDCQGDSGAQTYNTPANYKAGSMGGYLTYEEFLTTMDDMAAAYPNLITPKAQIGNFLTVEGRPIYWLKISDNPSMDETNEPEVLYTSLHHSREPNSLSQLVFYMWYLLENYESDPEVKFIVDENELYFIPMVNPDGYAFNQSIEPNGGGLWRKNRLNNGDGTFGVDLNRNYGHKWGFDNQGSSIDPANDTYRGTSEFSEVETSAVKFFCEAHNFEIALNYHTFGNLLIHPWGYNDLPTDEDNSFKALGNVMIEENSYKLGTGSETVGYKVNGDSDDWMYGEQTTKNKIYAFTPEVGPDFWPNAAAIDNLNKNTIRMNINSGLLPHNLINVIDNSPSLFVGSDQSMQFILQHAGLKDGKNTITLSSTDPAILTVGNPYEANMAHLDELIINIPFTVDPTLDGPKKVSFTLAIDNGSFTREKILQKNISPVAPSASISNDVSSVADWSISTAWGLTDQEFVSGPTSMSDSPNGNYATSQNAYCTLAQSVDLSQSLSATLKFQAKWAIENNYDYVQILGGTSSDPASMTALCGKFTNLAAETQATVAGEQVYDGAQSSWIAEEIDLSQFLGEENVYFSFHLVSDGYIEQDGFYFDDLEVVTVESNSSSTENIFLQNNISLSPNPAIDYAQLIVSPDVFESYSNLEYTISNLAGQIISSHTLNVAQQIDLAPLAKGAYEVSISSKGKHLTSKRLIVQ